MPVTWQDYARRLLTDTFCPIFNTVCRKPVAANTFSKISNKNKHFGKKPTLNKPRIYFTTDPKPVWWSPRLPWPGQDVYIYLQGEGEQNEVKNVPTMKEVLEQPFLSRGMHDVCNTPQVFTGDHGNPKSCKELVTTLPSLSQFLLGSAVHVPCAVRQLTKNLLNTWLHQHQAGDWGVHNRPPGQRRLLKPPANTSLKEELSWRESRTSQRRCAVRCWRLSKINHKPCGRVRP